MGDDYPLMGFIFTAFGGIFTGVTVKIVYDIFTAKPKKRINGNGKYDPALCRNMHEHINKDIQYLEDFDKNVTTCLNKVKGDVHEVELDVQKHEHEIRTLDKSVQRVEDSLEGLHGKTDTLLAASHLKKISD